MARVRRKKYGTLDEALTAGTGMDKAARAEFRKTVDGLFKIRNKSKEGSAAWKKASNKIAAMHGWPQKY